MLPVCRARWRGINTPPGLRRATRFVAAGLKQQNSPLVRAAGTVCEADRATGVIAQGVRRGRSHSGIKRRVGWVVTGVDRAFRQGVDLTLGAFGRAALFASASRSFRRMVAGDAASMLVMG